MNNMYKRSMMGTLGAYNDKSKMSGARRFAEGGMMGEEQCGPGDRRKKCKKKKKRSGLWDTISNLNKGAGTRRPRTGRVKQSKKARRTNRRMGIR